MLSESSHGRGALNCLLSFTISDDLLSHTVKVKPKNKKTLVNEMRGHVKYDMVR